MGKVGTALFGAVMFVAGWLNALPLYVYWSLVDGDWLNDYITHLPEVVEMILIWIIG